MDTTDYDRYLLCMAHARTMMMMARAFKQIYGKDDNCFKSYVKRGIESCKLAMHYKQSYNVMAA